MAEMITAGEFDRRMQSVEKLIIGGFKATDDKLDDHAFRLTKLETLYTEKTAADKKETRKSAAGWSTAVASGIVVAFEAIKLAFGK